MATESERRVVAFLSAAGLIPSALGVDRDEAWAKFFHNGKHETITAGYGVDSTDENVAGEIRREAKRRGIESSGDSTV
jgi:hypothetical protein